MVKCLTLLFLALICFQCSSGHRKLSYYINPGCEKCDRDVAKIIHIVADSDEDRLHHVWDLSVKPTVLLSLTSLDSNLTIDWEQFLWNGAFGSVSFTSEPQYVFAQTIDQIIDYNDVNNSAQFDPTNKDPKYVKLTSFNQEKWKIKKLEKLDNGLLCSLEATSIEIGTAKLTLSAYGKKEHSQIQPHLLHTSNSSEVDLVLDEMKTYFNHSRIGLSLIVVNTNANSSLTQSKRKSLDDEHSPGIFTIAEVQTPENEKEHGFLQWRTVAYLTKERTMTSSTDVIETKATKVQEPIKALNSTFVYALFGDKLEIIPVNIMHVTFGAPGDEAYYPKTKYLSWTYLTGTGYPADEAFSILVILILSIGLGLPAILIIIGTVCIIIRRVTRARNDIISS